jgi:uncharacterized protein (TIGR02271 family)
MTREELAEARERRARVLDAAGEPLGEFEALYYDELTGTPTWIGIRIASPAARRVLAPAAGADLAGEGSVRLAHDREAIEACDPIEEDTIDADAERGLRAHYGLPPELTRYEEELRVETEAEEAGTVRVRKSVETELAAEEVARAVEDAGFERVPVEGEDSGLVETLPDGSVSIPLFEEELVVTKRLVVRERVVVRKETKVERETVSAELRRERVDVEADPGVELTDER